MGIRYGSIAGLTLDEENPICWEHPSNTGLVSCWDAIAGSSFYGGNQLRDMCFARNVRNPGTLTGGPTWSGLAPVGGYGSLNFDGSNDYIGIASSVNFGSSGTVAIYCTPIPSTGTFAIGSIATGSNGLIQLGGFNAASDLVRQTGGTSLIQATGASIGTTGQTFDQYVLTWNPTTSAVYRNGTALTSGITIVGGCTTNVNLDFPFAFGARNVRGSIQDFLALKIASVLIYPARGLTAAEVASLYAESLRGNPNRYNWLKQRTYFGTAAAAATGFTKIAGYGGAIVGRQSGLVARALSRSMDWLRRPGSRKSRRSRNLHKKGQQCQTKT